MSITHFFLLITLLNFSSCQTSQEKKIPRFDHKSLQEHHQTKNINLLILWDHRIMPATETGLVDESLKYFLDQVMKNFQARIMITGIDGNPPAFFLTSNTKDLPSDFSSLFYQIDKLDLNKFARKYNPNISILRSINELIINFTKKNFFIKENDFMVYILSSVDDENFRNDMQGQKVHDELTNDVIALKKINQPHWVAGIGKIDDFTFKQLRLFVMAPFDNCHKVLKPAPRLFYTASQINSHFTGSADHWQGQAESANLCELNFSNFWKQSYNTIENRYQMSVPERELIPKINR